jgi:hypothetical protein
MDKYNDFIHEILKYDFNISWIKSTKAGVAEFSFSYLWTKTSGPNFNTERMLSFGFTYKPTQLQIGLLKF